MRTRTFLVFLACMVAAACADKTDATPASTTNGVDGGGASGTSGAAGVGGSSGGSDGGAGASGSRPQGGPCIGTACSSKVQGVFSSAPAGAYTLSIAFPGEAARTLDCPGTELFEADVAYALSCDAAGFLFRTTSAASPLATGEAVQLDVEIVQGAASLFSGPVTFPMTRGPYYDGGESTDKRCGGTTCWAHEATLTLLRIVDGAGSAAPGSREIRTSSKPIHAGCDRDHPNNPSTLVTAPPNGTFFPTSLSDDFNPPT